jgi:putative FmdB family regulatory protein
VGFADGRYGGAQVSLKPTLMPIYAYKCDSCGFAKDVLQKLSDAPLVDCPSCAQPAFKKQVTAAGFQLKGAGWYATDFKGSGAPSAAPTDSNASPAATTPASATEAAFTSASSSAGSATPPKADIPAAS